MSTGLLLVVYYQYSEKLSRHYPNHFYIPMCFFVMTCSLMCVCLFVVLCLITCDAISWIHTYYKHRCTHKERDDGLNQTEGNLSF